MYTTKQFRKMNGDIPKYNDSGNQIVIGCNYHTTWQSDSRMRFVLVGIKDKQARLQTRTTGKSFWTNVNELIFIDSHHNKNKAILYLKDW